MGAFPARGVDPDRGSAPSVLDEREARDRWEAHPLARFSDLVAQMLGSYTHAARHIVVIGDADGTQLWSDGHREVLDASGGIAFVPGRVWTEAAAGTNGIGTALALGHPVQIFSAEHFNRHVHGWTCSGAPVRDPETGKSLGVPLQGPAPRRARDARRLRLPARAPAAGVRRVRSTACPVRQGLEQERRSRPGN